MADVWDVVLGGGTAIIITAVVTGVVKLWTTRHKLTKEDKDDVIGRYRGFTDEQETRIKTLEKKVEKHQDLLAREQEKHRDCLTKYHELKVDCNNLKRAIRSYERALKEAEIPFRPYEVDSDELREEAGDVPSG